MTAASYTYMFPWLLVEEASCDSCIVHLHVSLARHHLLAEEASCDSCIVHLHVSLARHHLLVEEASDSCIVHLRFPGQAS